LFDYFVETFLISLKTTSACFIYYNIKIKKIIHYYDIIKNKEIILMKGL